MAKQIKKTAIDPLAGYEIWTCQSCEGTMLALERPKYCLHCGDGFKPLKSLNDYSWAEISEILEKGNAQEYFNIGDEKEVTLYTGEVVKAKLIGFNGFDELVGGGKVSGTFMFFIDGEYEMNETATNAGGWRDSKMRTVYMPRFFKLLPSDLRAVIKTAIKDTGSGGNDSVIVSSEDDLFLPSEVEITDKNKSSIKGEGEQFEWFKKNKLPSKWFWLRSPAPFLSTSFAYWSGDGYINYNTANLGYRVALCFCL